MEILNEQEKNLMGQLEVIRKQKQQMEQQTNINKLSETIKEDKIKLNGLMVLIDIKEDKIKKYNEKINALNNSINEMKEETKLLKTIIETNENRLSELQPKEEPKEEEVENSDEDTTSGEDMDSEDIVEKVIINNNNYDYNNLVNINVAKTFPCNILVKHRLSVIGKHIRVPMDELKAGDYCYLQQFPYYNSCYARITKKTNKTLFYRAVHLNENNLIKRTGVVIGQFEELFYFVDINSGLYLGGETRIKIKNGLVEKATENFVINKSIDWGR